MQEQQLPVNVSFEQFISVFTQVVNKHARLQQMMRKEHNLANKISSIGVRSRLFWTPAPVLTNQTPDPAPG